MFFKSKYDKNKTPYTGDPPYSADTDKLNTNFHTLLNLNRDNTEYNKIYNDLLNKVGSDILTQDGFDVLDAKITSCIRRKNCDKYFTQDYYYVFLRKLEEIYIDLTNKIVKDEINNVSKIINLYTSDVDITINIKRSLLSNNIDINEYNAKIASQKLTKIQILKGYYYSYDFDKKELELKTIFNFETNENTYIYTPTRNKPLYEILNFVNKLINEVEGNKTGGNPIELPEIVMEREKLSKTKNKIDNLKIFDKINISIYENVINLVSKIDLYKQSYEHWKKTPDYKIYQENQQEKARQEKARQIETDKQKQEQESLKREEEKRKEEEKINNTPCGRAGLERPERTWFPKTTADIRDGDIELKCVDIKTGKSVEPGFTYEGPDDEIKNKYKYEWRGGKSRRHKKSRRKPLKKNRKTRRHKK